ncbi:MAG: transporter substrate-binding domain-containing protein [Candidatus Omnitrophota bacterium]
MMRRFNFWLVVLTMVWVGAPVAGADTITLAADKYPPYNDVPESSKPGYVIEIADLVFSKAGHAVKYVVVPWTRAIEKTREGEYNGIIANFRNDAPDFVFPDNEVGQCAFCFFAPRNSAWRYKGIDSLKGRKIATIRGYTYTAELDPYLKDNPDVESTFGEDALEKNIKKMIAGRVDLVIEDKYVFLAAANRLGVEPDAYMNVGALNADQAVYISFGPNNPKSLEYARILSDGVDGLRASGELSRILMKYGLSDWK